MKTVGHLKVVLWWKGVNYQQYSYLTVIREVFSFFSLVPKLSGRGREKRGWYRPFAHLIQTSVSHDIVYGCAKLVYKKDSTLRIIHLQKPVGRSTNTSLPSNMCFTDNWLYGTRLPKLWLDLWVPSINHTHSAFEETLASIYRAKYLDPHADTED